MPAASGARLALLRARLPPNRACRELRPAAASRVADDERGRRARRLPRRRRRPARAPLRARSRVPSLPPVALAGHAAPPARGGLRLAPSALRRLLRRRARRGPRLAPARRRAAAAADAELQAARPGCRAGAGHRPGATTPPARSTATYGFPERDVRRAPTTRSPARSAAPASSATSRRRRSPTERLGHLGDLALGHRREERQRDRARGDVLADRELALAVAEARGRRTSGGSPACRASTGCRAPPARGSSRRGRRRAAAGRRTRTSRGRRRPRPRTAGSTLEPASASRYQPATRARSASIPSSRSSCASPNARRDVGQPVVEAEPVVVEPVHVRRAALVALGVHPHLVLGRAMREHPALAGGHLLVGVEAERRRWPRPPTGVPSA